MSHPECWGGSCYFKSKKTLQTCKPDSVPRTLRKERVASAIYLGPISQPDSALPTPLAGPKADARATHLPEGTQGVHGISTRKVYPRPGLHRKAVRSYRTFSPLPRPGPGRLFSVTLSVPRQLPESHRLGGAVLCVVRTFLPFPQEKAAERFAMFFQF